MAKYVIPSIHKGEVVLVKCFRCGALYMPEKKEWDGYWEKCPECNYGMNGTESQIRLWKYNLIKEWRKWRKRFRSKNNYERSGNCSTNH